VLSTKVVGERVMAHTEIHRGREFVTESDFVPDFWNFLLGLKREDLIAELIQNDLDQRATRTVISFERDRLVCEGNGLPVDADGWERLRMIRGAGNRVPAKRGKIGVKNHGLKTAFTIGDELRVMSDGREITQTLRAHGPDKPPFPGASPEPKMNPDAPLGGCRIAIYYRSGNLEPREGEAIVLSAVSGTDIDALFKSACASIPEQFTGIVSPEMAPRYEIVLRHWRLGEARFLFSCTPPRKVARGIETFGRRCKISGSADSLPDDSWEEAARRLLALKGKLKERVPGFYRRGKRFFVEASWKVDGRGRPKKGTGRYRYPIGYPQDSHEARTGHGIFFNAPVVSDTERHGPAWGDPTTEELRRECERLVVDVFARHVVPKWGPDALDPVVPSPAADDQDETVRPLLASLAERNAIPTVSWETAVRLLRKSRKLKGQADWNKALGGKHTREARKYRFIAPVAKWDRTSIHPSLAVVSPRQEKQLDPRVDPTLISLLADGHTGGFYETFITFDEDDARHRATGEGNRWFAASETREREFAYPRVALSYLDLFKDAIDQEQWDEEEVDQLQNGLLLPDTTSESVRFENLRASARLPSDIPGLHVKLGQE